VTALTLVSMPNEIPNPNFKSKITKMREDKKRSLPAFLLAQDVEFNGD